MKFLHIADLHLGMQPDAGMHWSSTRGEELFSTFKRIIEVCNEKHVDVLLIAGDLFHQQPLKRELKDVNYLFSTLKYTEVVLIAGNHDYVARDSYYRTFEWCENVHMLLSDTMDSVYLEKISTRVHGFSYRTREITEARYDTAVPDGEGAIHILLAHGGDDKHIPVHKDVLAAQGFDYVAFGHIHKPELLPKKKMAWSGSPEPCDQSEMGQHGYIIGEIERGITQFKFVPFAMREYVQMRVKITPEIGQAALENRLKKALTENGDQNIYKLVLEGQYASDAPINAQRLYRLGLVVSVKDESVPEYNIEEIYEEHKEDLIGMYIEEFLKEPMTNQRKKALYAGLNVLMMQIGA